MSVFIRRFSFDPGDEVLLEIESVNILDLDPPASISGVGTGTVLCVGEFENGPFATGDNAHGYPTASSDSITEVAGATDFVNTFGELGYRYGGVPSNNPCARQRNADAAVTAEAWNGNGFIQLTGKKFKRLLIARVDTSTGTVQFTREAFLVGEAAFAYNLEPSQTIVLNVAGTTGTATFSAAAATVTTGSGTYPTLFAGGETLVLGYDDAPNFTITFLSGDQSLAQVVARINATAGFTFAAAVTSDTFSLTGIRRGRSGSVRVVSGSSGVLTTLGLVAATTAGTGNVNDIDAVSFNELKAVVEAAISTVKVTQDSNSTPRIEMTYASADDWMTYSSSSTASAFGFSSQHVSNSGYAYLLSGSASGYGSIAGGDTLTLGRDDQANFVVAFETGDDTQAEIISRINQYAGYAMAVATDGTHIRLRSNKNGGEIRVISGSGGVLANLAFSVATVDSTALAAGKIPAGTVVQKSDGTHKFLTMQDVSVSVLPVAGVTASGVGPYAVKVRPATDDGTATSVSAGQLAYLERTIDLGAFKAENLALVNGALTEAAIDSAYADAFDATVDTNGVSAEANVIFSARQSNQVRKKLRTNANDASGGGCLGRMACVRPPLGTTRAQALSGSAEPGVGATRDQRVIYCFPGANTFVPLIAKRGLNGGAGFTATGNVDVGADGFMASILSQLPPEENPGQATTFMSTVNGVETSPNAQGFQEPDYTQFRAKGIAALRMDGGTAVFQSGVTSVDPATNPELRNIARRRMADFIQDTLAKRAKSFGKKLSTFVRRQAMSNEIRVFLSGLLSAGQPASQRIAGWTVDSKSGNTAATLAQGIYRIIVKVRTLASLDSIVLQTTIGESVEVEEVFSKAER